MTRNELIKVMERTWGEEEECVDALISFVKNLELIADIVTHDRSFNRYSCCYSWSELAYEIIQDEAFEGDEYQNSNEFKYLSDNADNEDVVKEYLINQNWALDIDNGYAIGFDDNVHVIEHEVL